MAQVRPCTLVAFVILSMAVCRGGVADEDPRDRHFDHDLVLELDEEGNIVDGTKSCKPDALDEQANPEVAAALKSYRENGFEEPAEIREPPEDLNGAMPLCEAGFKSFGDGNLEAAEAEMEKCTELDATSADAWALRAAVAQRRGKGSRESLEENVYLSQVAVSLEPLNAIGHLNIGSSLRALGKLDAAAPAFRAALALSSAPDVDIEVADAGDDAGADETDGGKRRPLAPQQKARVGVELGTTLVELAVGALSPAALVEATRVQRNEASIDWSSEVDGRLEEATEVLKESLPEAAKFKSFPADLAASGWHALVKAHWLLGSGHAKEVLSATVAAGRQPDEIRAVVADKLNRDHLYDAGTLVALLAISENPAHADHAFNVGVQLAARRSAETATSGTPLSKAIKKSLRKMKKKTPTSWFRHAHDMWMAAINHRRDEETCKLREVSDLLDEDDFTLVDGSDGYVPPSFVQAGRSSSRSVLPLIGSPGEPGEPYGSEEAVHSILDDEALRRALPGPMQFNSRFVYATVLDDVTVSGLSPFVYDMCRVYLLSNKFHQRMNIESRNWDDRLAPGGYGPAAGSKVKRINKAALLTQAANGNWYHWIAEIMSRFMFMRGAVLADPSIKLIVSERGYERTKIVETMRLLGISEDRLVKHGTDVTLRVKELLVVDWRGAATKRLEDGAFLPPREGLRLAREAFVPDPVPVEERTQILWISRNEAGVDGRRDVTNEEAVLRALYEELDDLKKANLLRANYTLMIFTGSPAKVDRAIQDFSRARLVIGVHGAGLANMLFCAPGTPVVEATLPERMYRMFLHMAAALELPYWAVADMIPYGSFSTSVTLDPAAMAATMRQALLETE